MGQGSKERMSDLGARVPEIASGRGAGARVLLKCVACHALLSFTKEIEREAR